MTDEIPTIDEQIQQKFEQYGEALEQWVANEIADWLSNVGAWQETAGTGTYLMKLADAIRNGEWKK